MRRPYADEDLRACWDFVRHDFDKLLDLLAWLDSLPDPDAATQLSSARYLKQNTETGQGK